MYEWFLLLRNLQLSQRYKTCRFDTHTHTHMHRTGKWQIRIFLGSNDGKISRWYRSEQQISHLSLINFYKFWALASKTCSWCTILESSKWTHISWVWLCVRFGYSDMLSHLIFTTMGNGIIFFFKEIDCTASGRALVHIPVCRTSKPVFFPL